jgi:hypothetical protein
MAYFMKIDPELVTELYHRRENLKQNGIRKPITVQVREAIAEYITKHKKEESPLNGTQKALKNNSILNQR